jgi:hypothetical protein
MSIYNLKRSLLVVSLLISGITAQDKVDAIEAARQAKAAAEKAAADAEAATDAAIEQAAKNAAQGARDKIRQAKIDEEERKLAEAKAAEEAELDAAASAAAEAAKRKMAEELGLEYTAPGTNASVSDEETSNIVSNDEVINVEEVSIKEDSGFNIGVSGSYGFLQGNFFETVPAGVSLVISTPYGFNLSGLNLGLSGTIGAYPSKHNDDGTLTPIVVGLGANLTIASLVFTEGHIGLVGDAFGGRGFAGISLEKLMSKSLNLPFNVLLGSEVFFSTLLKEGIGDVNEDGSGGSPTWWGGLGIRLDYNL